MSEQFLLKEKIYQQLLLLQADDEFMRLVLELRKKIKDSEEVFEDDDGDVHFISYDGTPEYKKDVRKIREQYKLSNVYQNWLEIYINSDVLVELHRLESFSHIRPRFIPKIEDPIFYTSEDTGEEEVHFPDNWGADQFVALELFPETTLKDIIKNWDVIAKERDLLYGIKNRKVERSMRSENLERDLEILKLKKQGKTGKQIANIINSNDRFKGSVISYEEVPKIIKRLKERLKRIIPNKET
jgi:hypothetical protein